MTTKKRYLRPIVQQILEAASLMIIGFFASLSDFAISFPIIMAIAGLLMFLCLAALVLKKYGRYDDRI